MSMKAIALSVSAIVVDGDLPATIRQKMQPARLLLPSFGVITASLRTAIAESSGTYGRALSFRCASPGNPEEPRSTLEIEHRRSLPSDCSGRQSPPYERHLRTPVGHRRLHA